MNRTWLPWLIASIGVPSAVIAALINGIFSPQALGLGLIFGATYLVAGILLFRAGPLWPRAGALFVLSCLAWGASVSLLITVLPAMGWLMITQKLGWDALEASFSGAYPEEIAKALGVLVMCYCFRRINRPWHGFVAGGLVGLGFEVIENIMYGAVGALFDANSDFDGAVTMWGMRLLAGPFLHVVLTSLSGWGIGLAMFQRDRLSGLWWFVAALGLHFLWNVIPPNDAFLDVQYVILSLIIYPLFVSIYVRAIRAKKLDNSYVLLM